MMTVKLIGIGVLLALGFFVDASPLSADPVKSGYDLFETDLARTDADLSGPAALVGIPFSGTPEKVRVSLIGVPIKSFRDKDGNEQTNLGTTDTVIERIGEVPEQATGTVQLHVVALSLLGIFTDDTGRNWEVRITQSEQKPSTGMMTIRNETSQGGTFGATLTVIPRFVFTSGTDQRVLDPGPGITFESYALGATQPGHVPWTHQLSQTSSQVAAFGLGGPVPSPCPLILGFIPAAFNELSQLAKHGVDICRLLKVSLQSRLRFPKDSQPKDAKGRKTKASSVMNASVDQATGAGFLVVTEFGSNTVGVVNLATQQIATIPAGTNPIAVDLTPDGQRAYVANLNSNDVYIIIIDIAGQRILTTFPVGNQPTAIAFDPTTNTVYTTSFGESSVIATDVTGDVPRVVGTISNITEPYDVKIAPNGPHGPRGYVSSRLGGIVVFDAATRNVITRVSVGDGLEVRKLAISPDGRRLYVAARTIPDGAGRIAVIDTASLQVIRQIPVESAPFGLTVNSSGYCLAVTHAAINRVSFVDLRTGEVVASFGDPQDQDPQATVILDNLAYVTNSQGGDNIAIYDLGPCR